MAQVCRPMKASVSVPSSSDDLTCTFCGKTYKRESTLARHICRLKRRFFEKETLTARLAFRAFTVFHEVHYRGKTPPSYEKFMDSTLYDAFLAFGKYIRDIDAISPPDYIAYMVKSGVPIDRWCIDSEYEKYVRDLMMRESHDRAVERTLMLMEEWGVRENRPWIEFFREISMPRASAWVMSGRISPWVLLNCASGAELMTRFSDEQMKMVSKALNIKLWNGKFSRHRDAVRDIQKTLKGAGL